MEKLEIRNVSKVIGKNTVLDNINLELVSGKIYGLVGKNGSGKTMLMRAVSGLMHVTDGEVIADGKVLHKDVSVLPNVGMILENVGLYPEHTGYVNLKMLAGIQKKIGKEEIKKSIQRVGLNPEDKRAVRKYSLGMKQRIVLAQALMEKPEVLLLDEPTNALDEGGVQMLRNIVKEEKERGAIILIASHSREDIEILCDEVYIMNEGKLRKEE